MGSVLKLGDEVIWPGPVSSLVLPYKKMAELMRPDLVVADCIRHFVTPVYQALIDDLEACGFSEANGTLVVAAYDWRRSIDIGSSVLATRLAEIVQRQGADVEISLIAHSMGGLVSRYFLETGQFDSALGFKNIARLITLATPHRGATVALPLTLGLEKKLFLNPSQVKQLASDPGYPSAYQLLPRRKEPIAWDWTETPSAGHKPLDLVDCYDAVVATKLGLVQSNLDSAVAFHAALDAGKRPSHVRYFCFSGNRQSTATHVLLKPRLKGWSVEKVEQDDGGDGTVPIWSSTLPEVQFYYVAGEHGSIFTTRELRAVLGRLLGRPGVLALGAATEIALKSPVVEPSAAVWSMQIKKSPQCRLFLPMV